MVRNTSNSFILILILFAVAGFSQPQQKNENTIPANFRISGDEMKLYHMINDYRRKYDLPPIPLSISLCYVASSHVKDLFFNHPDQDPCNFHSWSDKGPWKPFCYPRDENKKNSVWDKPKEFTPYKGKGYEIVYWENNQADIDSVINFWKSVGYFNNFLLNTGKWQSQKWEALGVGIYENYACAWFGEMPDPLGPPLISGETALKKAADTGTEKQLVQSNSPETRHTAVKEEHNPKLQPANPAAKAQVKYYIIVRSNVPLKDTAKIVKLYANKGFPAVKSLEKEGKARISVFESSDRAETIAKLKEIKLQYHDAWLLKN
jgi:hypothetical protein